MDVDSFVHGSLLCAHVGACWLLGLVAAHVSKSGPPFTSAASCEDCLKGYRASQSWRVRGRRQASPRECKELPRHHGASHWGTGSMLSDASPDLTQAHEINTDQYKITRPSVKAGGDLGCVEFRGSGVIPTGCSEGHC